jgi:hypothetical protein
VGRNLDLVPEYPFISGLTMECSWGMVEQVQGHFNFSACEDVVRQAINTSTYVLINPQTGHDAPLEWLPSAGVPTVRVCFKLKQNNPGKKCTEELAHATYPYYLAPNYFPLWKKYHRALHDWIAALPKNAEGYRSVQAVQVSAGSTGDITPWHGATLEPKYVINGSVWKTFWVNSSRAMWEIYADLLPETKLLFNGAPTNSTPEPNNPDAIYWPEYRDLIFNEVGVPNFDLKNGVVSHQYMTSNELDDYLAIGNITRKPYRNNVTGTVEFVRIRGESSNGNGAHGPGKGFWMNPTWNLLAMMCWDITYGLDVHDPNPQMWSEEHGVKTDGTCRGWSKTLWRAFQHFHTHAGHKDAASAPGGWLQLRDALDYADDDRFPVSEFGPVIQKQENSDRLKKIVQRFAPMGAILEDATAATESRHGSRERNGINSAGWRIWPHNYGMWLTQLNPMTTSVGRWTMGSRDNLLGQYGRQSVAGQNMSFLLAPDLFAHRQQKIGTTTPLYVRVAFFNEGYGQWELYYASTALGRMKLAARVRKNNTNAFIEVRVPITDLNLTKGVSEHFVLVDTDATRTPSTTAEGTGGGSWTSPDPDTFAWLEIVSSPFLYQMADTVYEV